MSNEQKAVEQWLDDVVIGLNLCPFAAKPRHNNQIRFVTSEAVTSEALLTDLYDELKLLENTPADDVETTLLILPKVLANFDDYNQFLDIVDELLFSFQWEGVFQVASFHPDYCFAETEPDSVENLTNRSPYPILHIIREASMEQALKHLTAPDEVFKRNIKTMDNLSEKEVKRLFPYLHK